MKRETRVIRVLGKSGTGKTTFIDKLVRVCPKVSIAVVKHSRTTMDPPQTSKDTALHFAAGVVASVGLSPGYAEAFIREPAFNVQDVIAFFAGRVDLILLEGARDIDLPTILIGTLPEGACPGTLLASLPEFPSLTEEIIQIVRGG